MSHEKVHIAKPGIKLQHKLLCVITAVDVGCACPACPAYPSLSWLLTFDPTLILTQQSFIYLECVQG